MSHADDKTFQIRISLKGSIPKLKSIQNSKTTQVITVAPQMSMGELLDIAYNIFGVPQGKNYRMDIYVGFPPKRIALDDAGSEASLVTANGIRGGDAVTVNIETVSKQSGASESGDDSRKRPRTSRTPKSDLASDPNATCEESVRPKRASAQAASDSFHTIIRAQDKMLREEKQKERLKSNRSRPNTARQKNSTNGRGAAAAHSRKLATLPGGRRLCDDGATLPAYSDDETDVDASRENRKISGKSLFQGFQSEEDISFALISSLESGGSTRNRKVSKILRASMKKTVEKSYEASRAAVRHSAISSGKVEFLKNDCKEENVNNLMGTCTVQYPKNVEGRGFYQEQVHIITPSMLKAVIQAVYDDHSDDASSREMLKPHNMALLSPRVFWSLWYHYHEHSSNIEGALELLLPNLDWSFLHHRSRQLSEKAKENLRQANQKMGVKHDTGGNVAAGIKAVETVETAMATMYDETVMDARQRAAEAALSRLGKQTDVVDTDDWNLKTPIDVDEEELEECILDCENGPETSVVKGCISVLISKLSLNNWRMLANASAEKICKSLKDEGIHVSEAMVDTWISSAQIHSIEEIMLEIIDGNQDLYEVLSDELSSCTPKDLSLWCDIPSMIIEEATSDISASEDDLKKYCNRAKKALNSLGWLELYSTPISDST